MADRFNDYDENTPVCASWLNQVDRSVFTALGSSDTPSELRTFLGVLGEAPVDGNKYARQNGGWAIVELEGSPTGDSVLLSPTTDNYNTVTLPAATRIGLRIKAHSGMTGPEHLFEIIDASDGVRAFINANGTFSAGPGYDSGDTTPAPTAGISRDGYLFAVGPTERAAAAPGIGLVRVAPTAGSVGVVVKNDAANTTDLLQALDSSNGVLTRISSDGIVYSGSGPNPGQALMAGGSLARFSAAKYTTNTTQQLLLESDWAGEPRKLWYFDSLAGSTHLSGLESSLILQRDFSGGLSLRAVQMRSFTGSTTAGGRLTLGHGYKNNTNKGYWNILTGENAPGNEALWISHGSNDADAGTFCMKITADGDLFIAGTLTENHVQ